MSDYFDPMDCSTSGFPVHHQLPEFTQTHVHWVSDVIQPSHPLLSPCPPAFYLFQHQGLFQWVSSSHLVTKVLEFQLQHQSFQWIFGTDLLQNGLIGSPSSPRDSQESSSTPQFKNIISSALNFLYSPKSFTKNYQGSGVFSSPHGWQFLDLDHKFSSLVAGITWGPLERLMPWHHSQRYWSSRSRCGLDLLKVLVHSQSWESLAKLGGRLAISLLGSVNWATLLRIFFHFIQQKSP